MRTDQADAELGRIAEDARDSLPVFFRHVTRASEGEHSFCVKYPFAADNNSGVATEQLWLSGIHFKNGQYYGVLANTPRYISGIQKGDTVSFDTEAVSDWLYVRDGAIIGGLSIRHLLEKIPEHERGAGDRELLRLIAYGE